jgi:hypothetical protein
MISQVMDFRILLNDQQSMPAAILSRLRFRSRTIHQAAARSALTGSMPVLPYGCRCRDQADQQRQ